jgi:hypothetical protein
MWVVLHALRRTSGIQRPFLLVLGCHTALLQLGLLVVPEHGPDLSGTAEVLDQA